MRTLLRTPTLTAPSISLWRTRSHLRRHTPLHPKSQATSPTERDRHTVNDQACLTSNRQSGRGTVWARMMMNWWTLWGLEVHLSSTGHPQEAEEQVEEQETHLARALDLLHRPWSHQVQQMDMGLSQPPRDHRPLTMKPWVCTTRPTAGLHNQHRCRIRRRIEASKVIMHTIGESVWVRCFLGCTLGAFIIT